MIKRSAELANKEPVLSANTADAIVKTCDEIINGKLSDQFVLDAIRIFNKWKYTGNAAFGDHIKLNNSRPLVHCYRDIGEQKQKQTLHQMYSIYSHSIKLLSISLKSYPLSRRRKKDFDHLS